MIQSAEDALRALRNKIVDSIEETEKQYAIDKGNFITIHEFFIAISERFRIVRTIDEMLDKSKKEEKHTHKWQENPITLLYNCKCGASLTRSQALEYLNKWQEQLDHAQQMRESHKRFFPNVD